jgi:hypothetical protein
MLDSLLLSIMPEQRGRTIEQPFRKKRKVGELGYLGFLQDKEATDKLLAGAGAFMDRRSAGLRFGALAMIKKQDKIRNGVLDLSSSVNRIEDPFETQYDDETFKGESHSQVEYMR